MSKYKGIVKWNGNHYYQGQEVKGSKYEIRENGEVWLFDDEPIENFPCYDDGRDEWVEVENITELENE